MCKCVPPRPRRRPLPRPCRPAATSVAAAPAADLPPLPQRWSPPPSHGVVHGNNPVAAFGLGRAPPTALLAAAAPRSRLVHGRLPAAALSMASLPSQTPSPPDVPGGGSISSPFWMTEWRRAYRGRAPLPPRWSRGASLSRPPWVMGWSRAAARSLERQGAGVVGVAAAARLLLHVPFIGASCSPVSLNHEVGRGRPPSGD